MASNEGVIFFHRFKKMRKEWESIAGNLSDWLEQKKRKKLAEHDYAKKSHLLLSHKRMNRYQLDVGLCKHKKIVGGDYSVFLAYEARNLNMLGLNSRVEWEKLTFSTRHCFF